MTDISAIGPKELKHPPADTCSGQKNKMVAQGDRYKQVSLSMIQPLVEALVQFAGFHLL